MRQHHKGDDGMTRALMKSFTSTGSRRDCGPKQATLHRIAAVAAGLLTCTGAAFAGQADICYSASTTTGQADKLTSSTPLECPQAGRHSLSQLAQAGWTIAAVQPVVVDYTVDPATHTPTSASAWQIVVQKEAK